jgi:hypothetical protein
MECKDKLSAMANSEVKFQILQMRQEIASFLPVRDVRIFALLNRSFQRDVFESPQFWKRMIIEYGFLSLPAELSPFVGHLDFDLPKKGQRVKKGEKKANYSNEVAVRKGSW